MVSGSCSAGIMEVVFSRPLAGSAVGVDAPIALGAPISLIWSLHDAAPASASTLAALPAHSATQRGGSVAGLVLVARPSPPPPPPASCIADGTCSPPPPSPPPAPAPPPPSAPGSVVVEFEARFAALSLAALDADPVLNRSFVDALLSATVAAAGVPAADVTLLSLVAGSVVARVSVRFAAGWTASPDALRGLLADPSAALFAAMPPAFGRPGISGVAASPAAAPAAAFASEWCEPRSRALCVAWTLRPGGAALRFNVTARTAGYASIGFGSVYGRMSPADVYAMWLDATTGALVMSHRRNGAGYDAPSLEASQAFATPLAGAMLGGELSAQFDLALGGGAPSDALLVAGSPTFLIWALADAVPASPTAALAQHSASGRGAAPPLNFFCTNAACVAVLPEPAKPALQPLHRVAAVAAGAVLAAGAALHAARRASPRVFETAAQWRPIPRSRMQLADAALVAAYGAGLAAFTARALADAATPGLAAGQLAALHLGLALLPVSRTSILGALLGAPFERAVAWHRAAAPLATTAALAHGWRVVAERGSAVLRDTARAGGAPDGTIPALGTAAAAALVTAAAFAAPPVRRRAYELFKAVHMACAPAAVALACLHSPAVLPYVAPGAAAWALDRAVRSARRAATHPAALAPLPDGATLLAVRTAARSPPGAYYFVCLPAVSAVQWHPFSVADARRDGALRFVVKHAGGAGSWTRRLGAMAAAGADDGCGPPQAPLLARLEGPYGGCGLRLRAAYRVVLLVAGGSGVTPLASIAADLLTRPRRAGRSTCGWRGRCAAAPSRPPQPPGCRS